MKIKNIYTLVILMLLMISTTAQAQTDSRNLTTEAIIQEGLAQLPAKDFNALDHIMAEMSATGKDGIMMLSGMMVPASQGKNATLEYAIDGIVNYVSNPENVALKSAVLEGLKESLDKCKDNANRAFLVSEMQKIASKEDIPFFESLVQDIYLKDYAQRAITTVSGLQQKTDCCSGNKSCENVQKMLKSKNVQDRCCGLRCLLMSDKANAEKNILKALKDPCIQYRNTALLNAEQTAGENIYAVVASKKWNTATQIDIVRWLGNNMRSAQMDVILKAIQQQKDTDLAKAGIEAAGKIGGNDALKVLIAQLGGDNAQEAKVAILSFKGKINIELQKALSSTNNKMLINALSLASERHIKSAYKPAMALTSNQNKEIRDAACKALAGVVTPNNIDEVCAKMEAAPNTEIEAWQNAAKSSIKTLSTDKQYKIINEHMQKTARKSLYYPMLAQVGNTASITTLKQEYVMAENNDAAYKALLEVNNEEMLPVLYEMAGQNTAKKDEILSRYLTLAHNTTRNMVQKYLLYRNILDLNPSSDVVKRNTLTYLSECHVLPALPLAAKYMDDTVEKTSLKAASAVKTIISKTPSLMGGDMAKKMLERALAIFKAQTNNADAGYAVDEINGQILPKFAKIGFELAHTTPTTNGILLSSKQLENFELYFEYETMEDGAVLNLHSMPQVTLGKDKVSVHASDKTVATNNGWNAIQVKVINNRLNVSCNGEEIVNNFMMKNTPETKALLVKGMLEIITGKAKIDTRSVYLHELP